MTRCSPRYANAPVVPMFAALFGLVAATAAGAVETKSFRDWIATCDDASACLAATPALGTPSDSLVLSRAGSSDAIWTLSFATRAALADRDRPINIRTDRKAAVTLSPVTGYEPYGSPDHFFVTSSAAGSRIYEEMIAGAALRIEYVDVAGGAHDLDFSLAGLAASLLWIDERQGRLESPRRIAAPVDLEPAPRLDEGAVIASAGIPPLLADLHERSSDCEALNSERNRAVDPVIGALSQTATVYALPCTTGAYQVSYRLYVVERGEIGGIRPLYFASFSEDFGWTGTDLLFSVAFDERTATLTSLAKERGLGDCGTSGTWVWRDYDFALVEFRAQSKCDGTVPENWPLVFRDGH